nr:MAG TPA: hypothetical protein [Caudoviricetes sp.]
MVRWLSLPVTTKEKPNRKSSEQMARNSRQTQPRPSPPTF